MADTARLQALLETTLFEFAYTRHLRTAVNNTDLTTLKFYNRSHAPNWGVATNPGMVPAALAALAGLMAPGLEMGTRYPMWGRRPLCNTRRRSHHLPVLKMQNRR